MSIKIKRNELLNCNELNELLATNSWDVYPIEKLEKCIETSWGNICARNDKEELIGYVRILSDGIRHAYICSLIVHPDYSKKGIGSSITKELLNMLREYNFYPTLVAGPNKKDYYKKFGFEVESNGFTAMCIRKPY
ncbi:ribosomal-protein-alanine acetyltransferase [Clostridium pasteurianum DSM 525 = ATCC 6013]|uniref:GCN5-related N-acetyltransferase n=1 Tax=Clostridium pasteurianum DSM 525 = ATCC 6013 TaxID=1262449 RepID=A0A0H3J2L1_CLOPA|nr:GNAT family N-acetyltransferase [Clostridium pasteurianum]AJA47057.1 ribosomal-protein-alanine acetyltransferase [Clostridium pasteurianum DSM 525 = ATCC 6013]AJA51045.1 ribosomal-protein-alanine acetyltransferase [Clostridium pasteurianum DSM 525 = ATCC 6013]AOZ74425.1 ribosomal-protein-alanine acetyltransferase [Clostridium pasteurianum DSM 525 = ATCC 6013]AOZ78222.1 ribosomal-protein-alanine acetyltransferase [Clostridium pasteurianum]ELP59555.1 ribosomal-protein-alanine acetyltransferas